MQGANLSSSAYDPYSFVAVFMVAVVGFALAPLALAWAWSQWFSPAKPGQQKNAVYECGLESKGKVLIQFKVDYYIYGIIFLLFDVETVFLLPFATAFTQLPVSAFLAMMVFLLLLVEGLAWAWIKGLLTWR